MDEFKGSKDNIFKMEYRAKVDLLKDVGAIANGEELSPEKNDKINPLSLRKDSETLAH